MGPAHGWIFESFRPVRTFLDSNAGVLGSVATSGSCERPVDLLAALEEQRAVHSGDTIIVRGEML